MAMFQGHAAEWEIASDGTIQPKGGTKSITVENLNVTGAITGNFAASFDVNVAGGINVGEDSTFSSSVDVGAGLTLAAQMPDAAVTVSRGTVAAWSKYILDVETNAGFWTLNATKGAALAEDTTQQVALTTIPVKTLIAGVLLEHTTAFAGTAVSAVTASIGTATASTGVATAYDIFQAVTAAPYVNGALYRVARTDGTTDLIVEVKTTDANISVLTAGVLNIYLLTTSLP